MSELFSGDERNSSNDDYGQASSKVHMLSPDWFRRTLVDLWPNDLLFTHHSARNSGLDLV